MIQTPAQPKDTSEDVPYAVKPENALRKKIGLDVKIQELLTPEKIKECQAIIDKAHVGLFDDALQNLAAIEDEYKLVSPDTTRAAPHLQKIASMAFVLKGRLEAIGLTLGYEVAKSLHEFSKSTDTINSECLLVLRKHLDILTVVVKKRTHENNETIGQEMLAGLSQLVKKMRNKT